MKNKNRKPRFISPRPGLILYGIILAVTLVFTQALRSPASAILFIFLLLLPIVSLVYVVIARAGIKVYTECDNTRVDKGQPVNYEIKIINETPIPFPFVETIVTLPSDNAVVCRDELMRITLLPFGSHLINSNVKFPLRGSYDIGVKYMHISDFFGLFRTEMKLELHRTVIVYPRNILMTADSNKSDTDLPTSVTKRSVSPEQAEPSDIRNYVPGDSMKNIHWKLSSKSEDLQVKDFSSNTDKHSYILCDLSFTDGSVPLSSTMKAKDKRSDTKIKNKRRRKKTDQSAGVASAKLAGDAGGVNNGAPSHIRSTEDRLSALGVTPERIAEMEKTTSAVNTDIMELATRKGERDQQKNNAERIARLASLIEKENMVTDTVRRSPYNQDILPFAGELCADSVIELAISTMRYEVMRGSKCTVLYCDSRSDNGFGVLFGENDVPEDPALLQLFTAPVCHKREEFSKLASLIEQHSGMTIRIVTANTDAYSCSVYSAIPAAFGGAGTGCIAEVLLANPSGLWASNADMAVASHLANSELSRNNIGMRHFGIENGSDGKLHFSSDV